jgi:hypothetical protein
MRKALRQRPQRRPALHRSLAFGALFAFATGWLASDYADLVACKARSFQFSHDIFRAIIIVVCVRNRDSHCIALGLLLYGIAERRWLIQGILSFSVRLAPMTVKDGCGLEGSFPAMKRPRLNISLQT